MKFLLLLLALTLVKADKLDRTYLPPPGAKYSGGTLDDLHPPLDVPKETYKGNNQSNGLPDAFMDQTFTGNPGNQDAKSLSTVPFDYPMSMFSNDYNQINSSPLDQTILPNFKPALSATFLPKSPSSGHFPSNQLISASPFFTTFTPKNRFQDISTASIFKPETGRKDTGYYYYVPAMQPYKTKIVNEIYSIDRTSLASPNEINMGKLLGNRQGLIPKMPINKNIVQNYQPNAFGYYGGIPMIMTSQNFPPQDFKDANLNPKFGGIEKKTPKPEFASSPNDKNKVVQAFQTPLVNQGAKNDFFTNDLRPFLKKIPSQLPGSMAEVLSKDNLPNDVERRNGVSVRPKYRPERPQAESDRNAVIINYENSISPEGYSYSYDTSNGIHADETATAVNGVRAKGSYSYTGDDGKIYTVTYTADENGFQPTGDHLPTAPPLSDAIMKLVEQAAKDEAAGIIDDGSYNEEKYGHKNYQSAMDRYNTYKASNRKVSRPNSGKKRPNNQLQSVNRIANNGQMLINDISKPSAETNERLKTLENFDNKYTIQDTTPESNYKGQNILNNKNKIKLEQNKEYIRKPTTYSNGNEIQNEKRKMFPTTQNLNEIYTPTNFNLHTIQDKIKNQYSPIKIPNPDVKVTLTDDGYYYVPPFIQFSPSADKTTVQNNYYLKTDKIPQNIDTDENKLTSSNGTEKRINIYKEPNSIKLPITMNNASGETTRQPYISGPTEQDKVDDYNSQPTILLGNDMNKQVTHPTGKSIPFYGFNTTPMTTQTVVEGKTPDEFVNQYFQSTTPTVFDTTLPGIIENRVKIPLGNPGITVSQDFVTTTYRPILSNGVLEVNQKVKIYGIGNPESTNNEYPEKVPVYNNDVYLPTTPNAEAASEVFPGYFYQEPLQGTPEFPGERTFYENAITTEVPVDFGVTGPYLNVDDKIPQFDKIPNTELPRFGSDVDEQYRNGNDEVPQNNIVPNTPFFSDNTALNPELAQEQKLTTPLALEFQTQGGRIIGEDFSGPKQPQKFDPATGYYYK